MNMTNVLVLDDQHELFFEDLERLQRSMRSGHGASVVPELVQRLTSYAAMHCPTEERLMQSYEYPLRDTHAVEHVKFRQGLRAIERAVQDQDVTAAIQLLDRMIRWQHEHIERWDAMLGAFLNERGVK